jgi:DnaJ-class molecular chaperone
MERALNKECVNCHGAGTDPVSRKTCTECSGSGEQLVDYESRPMPSKLEDDPEV